jgi:hypothetical protein
MRHIREMALVIGRIRKWWQGIGVKRYTKTVTRGDTPITMVAVVLAYNGWSTRNYNNVRMLFDATLASLVDMPEPVQNKALIRAYIETTYPNARVDEDFYFYLHWIPQDTEFFVSIEDTGDEHRGGSEFVIYRHTNDWIRA